jgi:hypothetical protein
MHVRIWSLGALGGVLLAWPGTTAAQNKQKPLTISIVSKGSLANAVPVSLLNNGVVQQLGTIPAGGKLVFAGTARVPLGKGERVEVKGGDNGIRLVAGPDPQCSEPPPPGQQTQEECQVLGGFAWGIDSDIEILRGPSGGALYGVGASGGVVRIVTQRPRFRVGAVMGLNWSPNFTKVVGDQSGITAVSGDNTAFAGGPLVEFGLTRRFTLSLAVDYSTQSFRQVYAPGSGGTVTGDVNAWFADLSVNYTLNPRSKWQVAVGGGSTLARDIAEIRSAASVFSRAETYLKGNAGARVTRALGSNAQFGLGIVTRTTGNFSTDADFVIAPQVRFTWGL